MANLNVTYDDLRDAARRLTTGKEDLHQKLTELSNLVQNLTSAGFQAEQSSAAYRDSFEQFRSGTSSAIDGLEGLASFLTSAADTLQQTDEGLANAIRG
jgi:WXG100 family type VII secretion target